MERISFIYLLFFAPGLLRASSAGLKLAQIESGTAKPGSVVVFGKGEIDEYAREQLKLKQVRGIRGLKLSLGTNRASGSAWVDFSLLQQRVTGKPPGLLSRLLLSGERELEVDLRISAAPRYSRVDILSVTVDGFDVSGRALDWMIDNYLRPRYPQVKINQWFELKNEIERIDVSPSDVRVKMMG